MLVLRGAPALSFLTAVDAVARAYENLFENQFVGKGNISNLLGLALGRRDSA